MKCGTASQCAVAVMQTQLLFKRETAATDARIDVSVYEGKRCEIIWKCRTNNRAPLLASLVYLTEKKIERTLRKVLEANRCFARLKELLRGVLLKKL